MKITEKILDLRLCAGIKALGGECLKLHPMTHAGIPDRLILLNGNGFFVELKSPGRQPTKLQTWWHARLKNIGFEVLVVSDLPSLINAKLLAERLSKRST